MDIKLINFKKIPIELQLETRNWRNSEQVAKYFQLQHITLEGHKKWLKNLLIENPKTIAFLIKFNDKPIGVTYFHSINRDKKETDWGIYIYDASLRGKGIGKKVIKLCINYAKNEMGMENIKLEVLKDNLTAKKLYEKFNFKFVLEKNNNVLKYEKIL